VLQTNPKIALVVSLAVGFLNSLADWLTHYAYGQQLTDKTVKQAEKHDTEVPATLKEVDPAQKTITVTISIKGEPAVNRTLPVTKSTAVAIDDQARASAARR